MQRNGFWQNDRLAETDHDFAERILSNDLPVFQIMKESFCRRDFSLYGFWPVLGM